MTVVPVTVEPLTAYSSADIERMTELLGSLSEQFQDKPLDRENLVSIIASPSHEQLVARTTDGTVVGIATVSIILGLGSGRSAWLEDFVVDTEIRGAGIGSKLWDALISWCEAEHITKLNFTSRPSRVAAQAFYQKQGAVVRETNFFKKDIA